MQGVSSNLLKREEHDPRQLHPLKIMKAWKEVDKPESIGALLFQDRNLDLMSTAPVSEVPVLSFKVF